MRKYLIGEIYPTNNYGNVEVIGYTNHRKRLIKFINTGFQKEVGLKELSNGCIRDNSLHPPKYIPKTIISRYKFMIDRCYNTNNKDYISYGAKGITVCDDWLLDYPIGLINYFNVISSLPDYDNLIKYPSKYHIDKDIKNRDAKCYSPDTVSIVSIEDNSKERGSRYTVSEVTKDKIRKNMHTSKKVLQFDINDNLLNEFDSVSEASKSTQCDRRDIARCCGGKRKTCGGFIWRFKE